MAISKLPMDTEPAFRSAAKADGTRNMLSATTSARMRLKVFFMMGSSSFVLETSAGTLRMRLSYATDGGMSRKSKLPPPDDVFSIDEGTGKKEAEIAEKYIIPSEMSAAEEERGAWRGADGHMMYP